MTLGARFGRLARGAGFLAALAATGIAVPAVVRGEDAPLPLDEGVVRDTDGLVVRLRTARDASSVANALSEIPDTAPGPDLVGAVLDLYSRRDRKIQVMAESVVMRHWAQFLPEVTRRAFGVDVKESEPFAPHDAAMYLLLSRAFCHFPWAEVGAWAEGELRRGPVWYGPLFDLVVRSGRDLPPDLVESLDKWFGGSPAAASRYPELLALRLGVPAANDVVDRLDPWWQGWILTRALERRRWLHVVGWMGWIDARPAFLEGLARGNGGLAVEACERAVALGLVTPVIRDQVLRLVGFWPSRWLSYAARITECLGALDPKDPAVRAAWKESALHSSIVLREASWSAAASWIRPDPEVVALARAALGHEDARLRIAAAVALRVAGPDLAACEAALRRELRSDDMRVRAMAAEAVARIGRPLKGLSPLLDSLLPAAHSYEREAIRRARAALE